MATSHKVLVVGATGYLGTHIVKQLLEQKRDFIALARNKKKLIEIGLSESQIVEAQVTKPEQLEGICRGVDVVISCLGITRQKDDVSYMDVDYQANLNILLEAESSGVRRFIYVSAFKAQEYPQVRLLRAKERFARRLLNSEHLSPCVIRPNGFFVDLEEFYRMAAKGRIYQFGQGTMRMNPIDGEDLASFCLSQLDSDQNEYDIGGPEVLSINELARLAFQVQNKPVSIVSVPDIVRRALLWFFPHLPENWVGPPEFFLTVLGRDAIAPCYGNKTIRDHFVACHNEMRQME
ncbi:SDR family oxidoreductase [Vibrio sp. Isolate23]|uniref:SDR family oxidoreductase n=1 Tax=Vibrio sp. Isolate23 TaxID=2908533 RepID=UPI001EFC65D0|nr:SDR family oxidoreductase [Vibrio sp. Isolate23]MCG9682746.1 SDR family oxidoreductase [Vibrio sp. Isolate23]